VLPLVGTTRAAYEAYARRLLSMRRNCDNMFILNAPGLGVGYVEQRWKVRGS
jgi:hypothetical protein